MAETIETEKEVPPYHSVDTVSSFTFKKRSLDSKCIRPKSDAWPRL